MNAFQEPKYKIVIQTGENCMGEVTPTRVQIVNRQSGNAIPDDEPIFILRARDVRAIRTLQAYRGCAAVGQDQKAFQEHYQAIEKRITQFKNWAEQNPDKMKNPDTQMDSGWDMTGKKS